MVFALLCRVRVVMAIMLSLVIFNGSPLIVKKKGRGRPGPWQIYASKDRSRVHHQLTRTLGQLAVGVGQHGYVPL